MAKALAEADSVDGPFWPPDYVSICLWLKKAYKCASRPAGPKAELAKAAVRPGPARSLEVLLGSLVDDPVIRGPGAGVFAVNRRGMRLH